MLHIFHLNARFPPKISLKCSVNAHTWGHSATHLFCLQNNTHRVVYKCTPFYVFPEHTLVCSKTHLKLCFVLVLNFIHFQVCSAHVLMCNKAHL